MHQQHRRLVAAAAVGQLLSLLLALMGVCSAALAGQGVSVPTSQSALNYALLALVYGGVCCWRGPKSGGHRSVPAWRFALLAVVDVQANACAVRAYRYTSLTSAMLLDCFSIPCVVLLSWVLLGASYSRGHIVGCGAAVAGLALLALGDSAAGAQGDAPAPLLGDALALLGAALYAASNVGQELLLGEAGRVETLAQLGAWGLLWSAAQAALLERQALASVRWSAPTVGALLGYGAALFAFSSLVPAVLLWAGAAALNLSLLSADLWAAAARIAFFDGFAGASGTVFGGSLALVAGGIAAYTRSGDVYAQHGACQGSSTSWHHDDYDLELEKAPLAASEASGPLEPLSIEPHQALHAQLAHPAGGPGTPPRSPGSQRWSTAGKLESVTA